MDTNSNNIYENLNTPPPRKTSLSKNNRVPATRLYEVQRGYKRSLCL